MRVFINALSVTNASGRHVLLGHLTRLAAWTIDRHEYVVLHHPANQDLVRDLGPNVHWLRAAAVTQHWVARSLWELGVLPDLLTRQGADALFTPAGIVYAGIRIPQIVFAQNPWALVPAAHPGMLNGVKAAIQRAAYRRAIRDAACMVFNSEFMQRAYHANAGQSARAATIVYQGIDDETFAAGETALAVARKQCEILSVSVMAPHKGVEVVVAAVALLRARYQLPATLTLIGAWPNRAYERRIRAQVAGAKLDGAVSFLGHVSRDELHRAYARARVFCLMSSCESFGIPAVEAQAFGLPVVSSDCCAIPEVCGTGGCYPKPGSAADTAASLAQLLGDTQRWTAVSAAARRNAQRFRWDVCSRPLVEVLDRVVPT